MKKQKITTLLLTMALCASAVLSGCAASAANQSTTSSTPFEEAKDSGTPISSDEASSVQAYENDEVLSSEEQAKAEQERRAEIAEKYSIYEPYGMTYDTEKDRFFYNGQVVRYFKDHINSNETNGFSYDDGVIDVEPIRDEDGTLTGLKQSSDADFNARTKEQEALKAEFEKAIQIIVMTVWTHTPNLAFLMTSLLIIGCTAKSLSISFTTRSITLFATKV